MAARGDGSDRSILAALRDFRSARLKANMEELMARLRGTSAQLLSFEEVRQKLRGHTVIRRELQDIPLDAIVGSVGRYEDFTRSFYPRQEADQQRWANVNMKMLGMTGLPPIEVYQIGQVYFVIDGNHRVSVARELGASHIEAYVTPVRTKVPLTPDVRPDGIILKARYTEFLERTRLDELRPGADLTVTVPGQYRVLDRHIELHRYLMSLEQEREVGYEEAVLNWYDQIYSVVVGLIREQGLLEKFPGRTETDLYLWVSGYRALLEEELQWDLTAAEETADERRKAGLTFQTLASQAAGRVMDSIRSGEPAGGLLPGEWRREQLGLLLQSQAAPMFRLFTNILVPISGKEVGWYSLYQALGVARREGGRLLGLHVVPSEAERDSPAVRAIKTEFNRRCVKAGIPGRLAVEAGDIAGTICQRARWADLTVVRLVYPPAPQPITRLSSGFYAVIRRCRSPLLMVPRHFVSPLDSALLAYDGSPKATEALYIATYLARQWNIPLTVLTVLTGPAGAGVLEGAQNYLLAHDVEATFISREGPVAETIVTAAESHDSQLIIMGGYSRDVLGLVLGSAVEEVLRTSRRPTLICR